MKKKKIFKLLSLAIATTLSLAVFVGCGNKDKDADTKDGGVKATNEEPGWKEDTSPITFDWYVNFSWFASKWGEDAVSKNITKKTGVNINFVTPAGNETEKVNTMIASGKLPDILTLGWYEDGVKKMIEGGLVQPLDELADKYDAYFYKVADQGKLDWYKQEDGHVYGYPNASTSLKDFDTYKDVKPSNQTFLVRKDMYEAIGKPDMRTPEGFLSALKAAKEKFPEVSGQPLIPMAFQEFTDMGNNSLEGYLQNFLSIPMEKDGKLYDRSSDPDYIKWLKTFREANENGLLSTDIFVDKRAQMEEKIAKGRYFAMLYQRSDMAAQQLALYNENKEEIYIAVDGPANSNLDAPKLAGDGLAGWTLTLISKDCKDPERAIKFMSYLISEEGNKDLFLGEEGVTWDNIDGKDQFKPEVLDLLNKDRVAFDNKYGASYKFWMLMDTNMQLKWQTESAEPIKALEDWTKGKTENYAVYDGIAPTGDTPEGTATQKIAALWGSTLPKLVTAKSEADFDKLFEEYKTKRAEAGYNTVIDYQEKQLKVNKEKLGME